jgi:hypothetical protein
MGLRHSDIQADAPTFVVAGGRGIIRPQMIETLSARHRGAEPRTPGPSAVQHRDLVAQGNDFQGQLVALAKSGGRLGDFSVQPADPLQLPGSGKLCRF